VRNTRMPTWPPAAAHAWRIVQSNGHVLATFENYASGSANSACESIKKSAGSAEIMEEIMDLT
jgi:uncharacterized protein YegP (UPF0339 family)